MIIIKEDKPKKVPGLTSLFISFPYNKDIITIVKSCDGYKYDDKLKFTKESPYLKYFKKA